MHDVMNWVVGGGMTLISALCGIGVKILWKLTENVASLNEKMAVIITSHEDQDSRLRDHEDRIRTMERQVH